MKTICFGASAISYGFFVLFFLTGNDRYAAFNGGATVILVLMAIYFGIKEKK